MIAKSQSADLSLKDFACRKKIYREFQQSYGKAKKKKIHVTMKFYFVSREMLARSPDASCEESSYFSVTVSRAPFAALLGENNFRPGTKAEVAQQSRRGTLDLFERISFRRHFVLTILSRLVERRARKTGAICMSHIAHGYA